MLSYLTNIRWDPQVTSPFLSLSRRVYPRNMLEVLAWAEELWLHHGLYSGAIQKAVRYFLTEVDITGNDLDYETREKYRQALLSKFDLLDEAAQVGDEYIAGGNSFTSIHVPFTRSLTCPHCGFTGPLKTMQEHYTWSASEPCFRGKCPSSTCGRSVTYIMRDVPMSDEVSKPKICHWPPQFIGIRWNPISQRKLYTLHVEQYALLQQGIRMGDLLYLEDTPWEIILAVCRNKRFDFADNQIFHLAYPVLSSVLPNMRGWGLPPFMASFETALLVLMLDKYTEAIVVDYLIPFRMLSPPPQTNGNPQADPLIGMFGGDFAKKLKDIINNHRKNPTDWNVSPFPLQYQTIGGEASQLVPAPLQEHFEQRLLFGMGIPPEFYNTKAQSNAGPVIGFKMFERTWQHFSKALNRWLTWVTQRHGELMKWEHAQAELIPLSLAENPEVRQMKFQLAANQQASMTDAFRLLNMNWREQQSRVLDEQLWQRQQMKKQQDEMNDADANSQAIQVPPPGANILNAQQAQQQQAQGGMPGPAPGATAGPAPGAPPQLPPGGSSTQGVTVDQLMAQAKQIAQQLFTADPLTRDRQLSSLKHTDEAVYGQVKSCLADMDAQAKQQGVTLARQGQIPMPG